MAKRKPQELAQLKIRLREKLRAQLAKVAETKGESLNSEIVFRLERSFSEEDALGGPDVRFFAYLMTSAFALGGEQAARDSGHADWTASDWRKDPDCYFEAVTDVFMSLVRHMPTRDRKELLSLFQNRLMTKFQAFLLNETKEEAQPNEGAH